MAGVQGGDRLTRAPGAARRRRAAAVLLVLALAACDDPESFARDHPILMTFLRTRDLNVIDYHF